MYTTVTLYNKPLQLYLPQVINKVVHSLLWIFSIQVYYVIQISRLVSHLSCV